VTISDYAENKLLDAVFNSIAFSVTGDPFISLHDADPGETGASEIVGGSYAREQAPFGAAAAGAVANTGAIVFAGLPECKTGGANEPISHVAVWDAVTAGNCLWSGALTAPVTIDPAGGSLTIATGDLDVTLN